MKSTKAALASGMIAMILATQAMAQDATDAAKMTCKDYLALDADAMMTATKAFMADPMAGSTLGDISDDEAMMKIMVGCEGMPEMTLMDSMHMKM
ncbi:HdeA/HdeB family chaperone [Cypionkella sp.]|uniref:HdeA/HdeB family chaperone n=1 Tax=Cypionkella sp. TaxID=2811411 RepID=UPI00272509E6|nr:HdeA/HdeB family chaperone [Cypionkella sp.]MDO8986393.1 HdeA/HdeB family chaperone [Cypionkella sp.]MDP2048266.1 HdeA/HdeB family chaperone [Cypionkella sp.]